MARRRFVQTRASQADTAASDSLDPWTARARPGKVTNRKALQLCRQIERTLTTLLPGGSEELLRDLLVQAVMPAPDATRVLVLLALVGRDEAGVPAVLAALARSAGWLRREVAAAIHRKKVPELVFQVT
jgi:ribosome-binding factor A